MEIAEICSLVSDVDVNGDASSSSCDGALSAELARLDEFEAKILPEIKPLDLC